MIKTDTKMKYYNLDGKIQEIYSETFSLTRQYRVIVGVSDPWTKGAGMLGRLIQEGSTYI